MNLFELLFVLLPIMGAVAGVGFGSSRGVTSPPGLALHGALGCAAGLAAYFLLVLLFAGLLRFLEWWRPDLPRCRQGRCGARDYEHVSWGEGPPDADEQLAQRVSQEGLGFLLRCRCGDGYVQCRQDRRVLEVGPEGTLRPYRYYKPFGRKWLPDTRG